MVIYCKEIGVCLVLIAVVDQCLDIICETVEIIPLPRLAMGAMMMSKSKAMQKFLGSRGIVKVLESAKRNLCTYASVSAAKIHTILSENPTQNAGSRVFRASAPFLGGALELYEKTNGTKLGRGESAFPVDVMSSKFHTILGHAGIDHTRVNVFNYVEGLDGVNYKIEPMVYNCDKGDALANFVSCENHLMYITDPSLVIKGYFCGKCSEGFDERKLLTKHESRGCKGGGTSWHFDEEDKPILPQLNLLFGLNFKSANGCGVSLVIDCSMKSLIVERGIFVEKARHARSTRNAKPGEHVPAFYKAKRTLPIYGYNYSKFDLSG